MTDAITELDAPGAASAVGAPPTLPPEDDVEPPEPRRFLRLTMEGWTSLIIVTGCVVGVFAVLSGPTVEWRGWAWLPFAIDLGMLTNSSTPAGGDMGAHVWGPAYLRDHLLPSGRLTGWAPDWYNGFPAYQFYMVVPSLAIALLSFVLPYGVAFKLVAVSGVLALPVCAWAFGRLTNMPFPVPPLLALGATAFLFDRSFSIYGGNLASTLAGEFAFSISLSLSILYLGVLGRGLDNGKHRGWAAALLALTALCHLIPFIFAMVCTVIWFVVTLGWNRLRPSLGVGLVLVGGGIALLIYSLTTVFDEFPHDGVRFVVLWAMVAVILLVPAVMIADFPKARLIYLVTTVPVGLFITAFWSMPFYLRSPYMNDMGWEKKSGADFANYLFSRDALDPQLVDSPGIEVVLALASVGVLMAIVYGVLERRRTGVFWVVTAAVFAAAFVLAPQGRLWNARLLPFYYLALYMLAAIGVAYIGRTLAMLVAPNPNRPVRGLTVGAAVLSALVVYVSLGVPLRALPAEVPFLNIDLVQQRTDGKYQWGPLGATSDNSFIDSWAKWNFSGYENKPAYPEYHDIVQTMATLGEERGCGRAMWEHEETHDRYGTPMALMLLPFWTDGCIGSQEGLYFEASSTTPYHFVNQDELSSAPSNAQRDLPYGPGAPSRSDFDQGVQHLQMLGVKYYMAISDRMIDFGRRNLDLTEVATSGPWVVFEVADTDMVTSLVNEPAVVDDLADQSHVWLDMSVAWYTNPNDWSVPLTDDGPSEWQRINQGEQPEQRPVQPVEVTNISSSPDGIEFDVSRVGTPVLVRTSYFPNWKAHGADGPWRVTPNLMVVVPTDTHVELSYGWTWVDLAVWALTFVGLAGLIWLFRAPPVVMPEPAPPRRRRGPDDLEAWPPPSFGDAHLSPMPAGSPFPGPGPVEPPNGPEP